MKINDAALIEDGDLNDDIKIPTGEPGDVAISLGQTRKYANGGLNLKKVYLNSGDWNCDADATKSVAHGIAGLESKPHWIYVTMIADDDAGIIANATIDLLVDGSCQLAPADDPDVLILSRNNGGQFDSVNYNKTPFNRAWIKIEYIDA